jgi:hypothetical protein|tara:strand:- start:446 stop:664 length:219 start_codon:yes stop_codon:yes gene_type:complete
MSFGKELIQSANEALAVAKGDMKPTDLGNELSQASILDRIKPLQSRVAALGPVDPDFEMKAFTDELCEKDGR